MHRLVCRRRCYNADEFRDRANNVTIPARGWLVLRRVAGKRPRSTLTSEMDRICRPTRGIFVRIAARF